MLDDVIVAGHGETAKRRPSTGDEIWGLEKYFQLAAKETLDAADMDKTDVDGVGISIPLNETGAVYPSAIAETLGFENLDWLLAADHGGASATELLIQGALAVQSGVADVLLCLGADMPHDPRAEGAFRPRWPRGYETNYLDPFGEQGANTRFALVQRAHMDQYGTTLEQLGKIAVAQRKHAVENPYAYFDTEITMEEYLESTPIADPIRLLDCVIPVNAGKGVLLCSRERYEASHPPVRIEGFGKCMVNHDASPVPDLTTTGIEQAGQQAREMAGADPSNADFYQLYDDYPVVVLMQLEDLGLCEKGEGGAFVEGARFDTQGDIPLNTSGGQLSAGQAGAAGGFEQLLEGVKQLRGESTQQLDDPEWGIVTGTGGLGFGKTLQNNNVVYLSRGDAE